MQRLLRALAVTSLLVAIGVLAWMCGILLDKIHTVVLVVIFAVLFAYLIYPPVKVLSRHMPRPIAVLAVYAGIVVLALVALAYLAPAVAAQATDLAKSYPQTVKSVQDQIAHPTQNPLLARFPAQVRDVIASNAARAGQFVGIAAGAVGSQTVVLLQGGIAVITVVALAIGLTSFFITDIEQIQETFLRMIRPQHRAAAVSIVVDIDRVIGGFVRGQVLLAVAVAILTTIILAAMGVQYALLLGVLTGIISIVPIVGAIVGVVPAFLVAVFTITLIKAIVVLVLFILVLQVQANVVAPLVNSRSVGVSPLIVFLALIIGSEAYGILGTLLAIPLAGIVRVVYDRIFPPDPSVKGMIVRSKARSGDLSPSDAVPKPASAV